MALVLLRLFNTSVEAAMARSRLAAEGIESHLFDVENAWDTADRVGIPVRLMVAEEDREVAGAVLAAVERGDFSSDSV